MHLALVLDRFDPDRGGLEHWAWQWTQWLLARGHAVSVVAAAVRADLQRPGLALYALGEADSRLALGARVAACLADLRVDLVHDLGVGWRYDLLQPQFGSRLVNDRQQLRALSGWQRLRARASRHRRRRLADLRALERRQYVAQRGHVVAVSEMTKRDLCSAHGLAAERVTVIHNGVDAARFAAPQPAVRQRLRQRGGWADQVVLLFAAHNFPLKGLETVLRALARLRTPRLHLLVTGRGPVAAYAARATQLGIAGQVTFAGVVPDVREAFAVADAFVQPTFYDPCSLVLLEAAASGLPLLTSRRNGAAELFRDGASAWIVADPADAGETARRLETFLDAATRARMGAAAHAVAQRATADAAFATLFALCEARRG
ncbi:MAG: glycosyltransferase family 4 protein [Deltaproteobacteria bacterium]|nr:glycosyltransferase family 4 protein [Deltaproteobacteria bacterium]